MKRCDNCGSTIVPGGRKQDGREYCSKECLEHGAHSGFCAGCLGQSLDISAGDVISVNFFGRGFGIAENKCEVCNSVERNLFFSIGAPLIPLGRWKVKNVQP